MADDLTRPYIGYRSAGRRPERQQDRRASADAPLAALRGMISGVAGAPGDIESLVRMLPGLSEQTVLPTSEDIERRLPLRGVSETPVGRAFTTAGQLGGGFYTGPGSPLRAIAALPSAVSRAGRDFVMASGQPAVNVVKPKGGNWLSGSVEREIEPLRQTTLNELGYANLAERAGPEVAAEARAIHEPRRAMNRWLETKLAKYIKNEMGTAEDPIRALAEKGPIHADILPTGYNVARARREAGFPEEGMGVSPLAKTWEDRADTFINPLKASDITGYYPETVKENPWLLKVPPETPVYEMLQGSAGQGMLGFGHLVDELKNAINPASGLPENLRWKYQDLEKVTVPQAVQRVADINAWRAAQKAEADLMRAQNAATFTHKEYPEAGFKWVEIRQPEAEKITQLPEGWRVLEDSNAGQKYHYVVNEHGGTIPGSGFIGKTPEEAIANTLKGLNARRETQALEDALKYEGETMGHCVGGYCPDVLEGRSRIYSLRDKKGQPHVTIEVAPPEGFAGMRTEEDFLNLARQNHPESIVQDMLATARKEGAFTPSIVQIKGKANRAPNAEYLPYVQDFVRSGQWGRVGDLQNTGLKPISSVPERQMFEGAGMKLPEYLTQSEHDALIDEFNKLTKPPFDPEFFNREYGGGTGLTPGARGEGFSLGGLVGGANFPTYDFDPARIDSIVGELHAMNAG